MPTSPPRQVRALTLVALLTATGACDDAADAPAPSTMGVGKADGATEADAALRAAVLRVANEQSAGVLDDVVALDGRAVANIVAARAQQSIASYAELDALGFVGPNALSRLGEFAVAAGYVAAETGAVSIASWNFNWLADDNGQGEIPRAAVDYERLGAYAERLDADVVVFQEVQSVEAAARIFSPDLYRIEISRDPADQVLKVGFAIKHGLNYARHRDVTSLDVGGFLRNGVDISVNAGGRSLRMLGIHLKSGCWQIPLDSPEEHSCATLHTQVDALEAWIDARALEDSPFAVLGDFNRRLNQGGDEVWQMLDDADPANANLSQANTTNVSPCWGDGYRYIDHIVFGKRARRWMVSGSFHQQQYDADDLPFRDQLSDHCPIEVAVRLPTQ